MPVRVLITDGTTADCSQASTLIEGITAQHLLADKAYDSHALIEKAISQGITVIIPPKSNRRIKRSYDKDLYKLRHLISNYQRTTQRLKNC